jgi:hypothetical protein
LKAVYADADETELMKMAVRMPDALRVHEIDENDTDNFL